MAKLFVEIELGNAAMQTGDEVVDAITDAITKQCAGGLSEPMADHLHQCGAIRDANGNSVGKWQVEPE